MIYLVCGTPRTCSSAFMQGSEAGGMAVVTSAVRDEFNRKRSDQYYRPNPRGLYEPDRTALEHGWTERHNNKAIKRVAPFGCNNVFTFVDQLPISLYSVVFLRRDSEEVRQSYEAMMGMSLEWLTVEYIERASATALEKLQKREDCVSVVEIEHRDLIADPITCFRRSKWPIDHQLAAAVIDPSLHRFQREKLVEGI